MSITLDEALRLLETKQSRVYELRNLLSSSGVLRYEQGDDEDFKNRPERTITDLLAEINFLTDQLCQLRSLITSANVSTPTDIEYFDRKLSLGEVLTLLKELRAQQSYLTTLTKAKNEKKKTSRREIVDGRIESVTKIEVHEVLYDVAAIRKLADSNLKFIDKLQSVVNYLGVTSTIDFVDSDYAYVSLSEGV